MASVGKRANGKWEVRYLDPNATAKDGTRGVHRSKSFRLEKEAKKYRAKVEIEVENGQHIAASEMRTVKSIVDEFVRYSEDRWKDGRIGQYRYEALWRSFNRHIIPAFGHRLFSDIQVFDIDNLYRSMQRSQRPVSPSTAKTMIRYFQQVEKFALRRKYILHQPVSEALQDLRGVKAPKIRTFTMEEIGLLVRAVELRGRGQRNRSVAMMRCFVYVAAFCGLRYGEIMGLTRQHVDLDMRLIRVRHSLTEFGELKGPKTEAGVRDVPMPLQVYAAMKEWLDGHFLDNAQDLVFRSYKGAQISRVNFHNEHWRPLLKRAGVSEEPRRLTFHALRHFNASMMLRGQFALPDVAALLGHAKVDMTLGIYAHSLSTPDQRRQLYEDLAFGVIGTPVATIEHGTP